MNSKEAIKRLRQEPCPCKMCDFDKEECLAVIENDLLILETIKNSLIIERTPPKLFNPNQTFDINDYIDYAVKYTNYKLDKKIQEKLTKWIIKNIDKKIVKEWLENE